MRITRLVAPPGADPAALARWMTDVLSAMRIVDINLQPPETAVSPVGKYQTITTSVPLGCFPAELRPEGVPVQRRSLRVDMLIRPASHSEQTGTTQEGFPILTSTDRGYEADIVCSQGSGKPWDVEALPDLFRDAIALATDENGNPITMTHSTISHGDIVLPAAPIRWAVVDPIHPSVNFAIWQSPVVEVDPNLLPPGVSP